MEKTGEATKEPKKESPYKKGTISSSYKKEEEPENDDAGDGLFWIK
jgi:hypothetical protein